MNVVELNNVTFSYDGKTKILDNVSFHAQPGEIVLVAGHSGEGKSTLLSIISGIIPNVNYGELSGQVLVNNEDISGKTLEYVCRKVGVVLQNADEQIVHKIVEDEIAFGCENIAYPHDKIAKQIEIVCSLMKLDKRYETGTLSGGQKQRLITASTLAMGQKIIALDEPLANLDKDGAKQLMTVLRTLVKAGYCAIIVEHRLDMVLPYVDKVFHIGNGKIEEIYDKLEYLQRQTNIISDTCEEFKGEENILELSDVCFTVKDREILKGITADIKKGSRTVLLGENGCGKTTLLRLVSRLNKPTSGTITQYLDEKLGQKTKGSKAFYKKVGIVYQNPDYQLFMPTVRKEIEFSAVSKDFAKEIIEMFGLQDVAERHPHSLSEGQKRRVSIAAVVACQPEILILDEPTVGQDYEGLCKLVRIINDLHTKTNNTVITITHDMRCAEALCDRALLIENGVIAKSAGKELVRDYFSIKPEESEILA